MTTPAPDNITPIRCTAVALRVTPDNLHLRRAQWSANREAQHAAQVGVSQPLPTETPWRIRYALGIAGLVFVFGVYEWSVF